MEKKFLTTQGNSVEGKDIQIIQDTKILQQILRALPSDLKNQINVIMVNEIKNHDGDFELLKFLQSLPEPRMKNLKKMAIKASMLFFKKKNKASEFLGIDESSLGPSYRGYETKELLENE